jgi:iron complex transport system ATP-binding protein
VSALLRCDGVSFSYPGVPALEGVDLELRPGELVALLGPNGSGKSTLLELAGGLHVPQSGQVRLGEDDPARLSRAEVARRVAYLPARATLPPDHDTQGVVLMGRYPYGRGWLADRPEDVTLANEALARVGAATLARRPTHALSSGERQRVLLARVLCQEAELVLLDEPSSAQDLAHALDLFGLFRTLAHEEGRCVVLATHALNDAARFADRLVVLNEGRLVREGPPTEVLDADLLREVFAVEALLGEDAGQPFVVPRQRCAP